MKTLIFLVLLSSSGFAQAVEKRTGETIYLTVCGAEGDTVNFYRKTGVLTTPSKIGFVLRIPGIVDCKELQYLMPSGTTREYRFFAVPIKSGEFLDESNGVRVKRKK